MDIHTILAEHWFSSGNVIQIHILFNVQKRKYIMHNQICLVTLKSSPKSVYSLVSTLIHLFFGKRKLPGLHCTYPIYCTTCEYRTIVILLMTFVTVYDHR